jgi:hypothetical protein
VRPSGEYRREPEARAFGSSVADLELDFAGLPRPIVVTEVLRICFNDGDEVWSWTLPRRTQGLIEVALASGDKRVRRTARCPETQCGEVIELEVELTAFLVDVPQNDVHKFPRAELAASAKVIPAKAGIQGLDPRFRGGDGKDFDWSPEPGRTLRVALPTGEDQRSWLSRGESSPLAMARQLVEQVDGRAPNDDWELPENWLGGLEAELERRDPLTALELEASCPACGAGLRVEFDLESELLRGFEARQARMLRHVHRLASVYHWPEAEILRLPAWRRDYYLRQLEAE